MLHSGTFEWTILLETASAHDSEHECIMIIRRRARFVPYNLCASRPSTTSTSCSSLSTTSHIVLGICPLVAQRLVRAPRPLRRDFESDCMLECDASAPDRRRLPEPRHDQRAQPAYARSQSLPRRRRKSCSWPKGPAVKTGVPTVASSSRALKNSKKTPASGLARMRCNATVVR